MARYMIIIIQLFSFIFFYNLFIVIYFVTETEKMREAVVMMMITIYRAQIYACCNSMLIALERPQSSSWLFLSLLVRAVYVCVAIIHRTLTRTTESLSCAQMLMYAIAHRGVRTPKESVIWIFYWVSLSRLRDKTWPWEGQLDTDGKIESSLLSPQ